MDPLTHVLVGANLSATRLGEKARFAAATLVVGANLPDVDGVCYVVGHDVALGFRRGWTHGVLALVVLPLLLGGLMYAIDRRWGRGAPPSPFRWHLALAAIGIWSHPTLDWLNTYGMRWLMPFDGRWFYGDAVFIMDVWLWLVLGVGYLVGRRPTAAILVPATLIGGWIVKTVWQRAPDYLPLVVGVFGVLLAALFWTKAVERPELARRIATAALVTATAYIGARLLINEATEAAVGRELALRGAPASALMAGPDPITPATWQIVAATGDVYRFGEYDWLTRSLELEERTLAVAKDSPEWRLAKEDPAVRGLVTWMRFPSYEIERRGEETLVHIVDARRRSGGRRATVVLPAPVSVR